MGKTEKIGLRELGASSFRIVIGKDGAMDRYMGAEQINAAAVNAGLWE